jgi:hypothetical protein
MFAICFQKQLTSKSVLANGRVPLKGSSSEIVARCSSTCFTCDSSRFSRSSENSRQRTPDEPQVGLDPIEVIRCCSPECDVDVSCPSLSFSSTRTNGKTSINRNAVRQRQRHSFMSFVDHERFSLEERRTSEYAVLVGEHQLEQVTSSSVVRAERRASCRPMFSFRSNSSTGTFKAPPSKSKCKPYAIIDEKKKSAGCLPSAVDKRTSLISTRTRSKAVPTK